MDHAAPTGARLAIADLMTLAKPDQLPRVGMFATVRNRRGVVSAVEPFDGDRGRIHLAHLEYKDDQLPLEERLLWELEPRKRHLEPNELPDGGSDPMRAEDYDALVRAARWTAGSPWLEPDGKTAWTRPPPVGVEIRLPEGAA